MGGASAPIELCLEMAEFVLPGYVRMWRDAGSAAAAFNGRDINVSAVCALSAYMRGLPVEGIPIF